MIWIAEKAREVSMLSALLINGVPIECINQAAETYYVPAKTIISVLKTEGGRPGMASSNKNGTHDYGPMQVNTIWLKQIAKYGYTKEQLQYDACVNVHVGTWILSQQIASTKNKDYWHGVASYHSRTPSFNQRYREKVHREYKALNQYLARAGV